jgi:hypothetical protein
MNTSDRLAAAQTARHQARSAFNSAVRSATTNAISRGFRTIEEIDAAVESDAAVIAARVASATAESELKAAQTAATADERLALVQHDARTFAASLGEGTDRPEAGAHGEESCVTQSTDTTPAAPVEPTADKGDTTMTTYNITSKTGADHGDFKGATPAEALCAMLRDAGGYRVNVEDDDVVFANLDDREVCGGVDDWTIRPVTSAA